jgi:Ca2+-binding EF-hand superfamily protein
MKTLIPLLLFTVSLTYGQSNSKGPDSPIAVGVVTAVSSDGKTVTILQGGDFDRDLTIDNETKVNFVGMVKEAREIQNGYGVKAKVKNGVASSINLTQPVGEQADLGADRHTYTVAQVLEKADDDGNGTLDYVESAKWVYYSPKHGPDHFTKVDKDGDGGLNEEELESLLNTVSWWKYSRQSADDWFAEADSDDDGLLNKKEFTTICSGKSHVDNRFKRTDSDKSGTISPEESSAYIKKLIQSGEEE